MAMEANMCLQKTIGNLMENEDSHGALKELSDDILSGQIKLLDLIEALGVPLTNKDQAIRLKATSLLVNVVEQIPSTLLVESEVASLVRFFCARLDDHHSLTPAHLKGLAAMARNPLLGCDVAVCMLRSIFKHVTVQTLVQADRLIVYETLQYFLEKRLEDVKTLGSEFVVGVIQTVDSEHDPRNLVCVFTIVHSVAQNFALGRCEVCSTEPYRKPEKCKVMMCSSPKCMKHLPNVLAEELFEVIACYFPIDFSPPPDYVHAITREQLVAELQACLAASSLFAKFCLPLLLEKLSSNVTSAKVDSMNALVACCLSYDVNSLAEYVGGFWSLIRNEIFSNRKELESQSLETLTALARSLSKETSHFEDFKKVVFQDCLKYVEEPEQPIFHLASKLLSSICQATYESSCQILDVTVPIILKELQIYSQVNQRKNLLELLLSLMKACRVVNLPTGARSAMNSHRVEVHGLFVSLLNDPSPVLRVHSVLGLSALLTLPSLLEESERCEIAEHFLQLAFSESDPSVRQECIAAMTYLASDYSSVVSSFVIPKLTEAVLRVTEDSTEKCDVSSAFFINLLVGVSVGPGIVRSTVPVFVQFLNKLQEKSMSTSVLDKAKKCISGLNCIVSSNLSLGECLEFFSSWLVVQCEILLMKGCLIKRGSPSSLLQHEDIIRGLSTTVRHVVQASPSSLVKPFVSNIIMLFLHGNIDHISPTLDISETRFLPLQPEAPAEQTNLLDFLIAVVCSVQSQDVVPESEELMRCLQQVATGCPNDAASSSASKCLAGLVNKASQGSSLDSFLQKLEWEVTKILNEDIAVESERKAVVLWSWLTKALVLRNSKQQTTFTNQLVDMLSNPSLADVAADGFRIVLTEFDDVSCTGSHAISTLMYKQRFFVLTLGRLLDGYHASSEAQSRYYLLAISYLIQNVPKQALTPELPMLMPVLVRSVSLEDTRLWMSTLEVIADLTSTHPDIISQYIDDLLHHLLSLSLYKPTMNVRIAALNCIHLFGLKLPKHKVLPHLDTVMRQIRKAMDDDKRCVRQKAVETRMQWSMMEMSNE